MKSASAFSIRLYRTIARAFPEEFRAHHGRDMVHATEDAIRDVEQREGRSGLVLLMLRILPDLVVRVVSEHAADFIRDSQHAIRSLAGAKGFTAAAAVSIGLGIGVSAVIFSLVTGLFLAPIPGVANPKDLRAIGTSVSLPAFEAVQSDGQFSEVAAYIPSVPFVLGDGTKPTRLWGHIVTPNYFRVLGAKVGPGREFGPDEVRSGAPPVVVISERLWRDKLGSRGDIVGQTVLLNGKAATVIGVAEKGFVGASPTASVADLWIATTADSSLAPELSPAALQDKAKKVFSVVGRLKPSVQESQVEGRIDSIVKRFEPPPTTGQTLPQGRQVQLIPGGRKIPFENRQLAVVVAIPVLLIALMLWIACSNVGTMLLARSVGRRKEIAIRLSLGASRMRLIRQLITESLMLGLLGGVVGLVFLALDMWLESGIDNQATSFVQTEFHFDWRTVAFTFIVSLAAGIMFGLAPALQATRADLSTDLKAGTPWRLAGYRRLSFRNVLVLQQVAGSLVLLLITGFVVLGMGHSAAVDPGFNARNLYMVSLDPIRDGYPPEQAEMFFRDLRGRIQTLPGVVDVSLAYHVPIGELSRGTTVTVRGDMDAISENLQQIQTEPIGVGFFETVGIPILRGRSFANTDMGQPRVIVNEAMAARTWPGENPIGKDVELQNKHYAVIGVARNYSSGGFLSTVRPGVFQLMSDSDFRQPAAFGIALLVRGVPGVDALAVVEKYLESTEPRLTVFNGTTAESEVADMLSSTWQAVMVYGGIGLYGLILAAAGLAGVTAFAVVQRTKEIGIRVALGASKFDVIRVVTREGMALVIAGTAIGLTFAFGIMRALASWFDAVATITKTSTSDPVLVVGGPVLLAILTFISCYLPARRATRIDPAVRLRQDWGFRRGGC